MKRKRKGEKKEKSKNRISCRDQSVSCVTPKVCNVW
jgi:hypothetical protein